MKEKKESGLFRRTIEAWVEGGIDVIDLFPRKYTPEELQATTYNDLVKFAYKCKKEFPETVLCRVVCEFESEKNRFRITQFALNSQGKAITVGKNCVARMLYANTLDKQIFTLCNNQDAATFDIPLHEMNGGYC